MFNNLTTIWVFTLILALALFMVGMPLVTIWAINTLFSTSIPFTIYTWAASTWFTLIIFAKLK